MPQCTAGPIGELELLGDSLHAMPESPATWPGSPSAMRGGERSTTITQGVPELGFGLTERWGVQVKLPYQRRQRRPWAPTAARATRASPRATT